MLTMPAWTIRGVGSGGGLTGNSGARQRIAVAASACWGALGALSQSPTHAARWSRSSPEPHAPSRASQFPKGPKASQ